MTFSLSVHPVLPTCCSCLATSWHHSQDTPGLSMSCVLAKFWAGLTWTIMAWAECLQYTDHSAAATPVASLCVWTVMTQAVPTFCKSLCGLKPAQVHCYVKSSFCWLLSFCTVLAWAMLVWLAQKCIQSSQLTKATYTTSWSTQLLRPFMKNKGHSEPLPMLR